MKKVSGISWGGRNERMGDLLVNRLLPNEQTLTIGSFVHVDHVYPTGRYLSIPGCGIVQTAHPHRGIVTISYLLGGSLTHRDSYHNRGTAGCGDVLWMKAGNGIIHEEVPVFDSSAGQLHVLRFWINLPAVNKEEDPEFRMLRRRDLPVLELPDESGQLRVILGRCGVCESPLPIFLDEFILHVYLHPKSAFVFRLKDRPEYGVFVPHHEVHVNGEAAGNSQLLGFFDGAEVLRLYNPGITGADVIVFGGSECRESLVAEGPFVMNSRKDIARAYGDFFEGRYGQLPGDPAD